MKRAPLVDAPVRSRLSAHQGSFVRGERCINLTVNLAVTGENFIGLHLPPVLPRNLAHFLLDPREMPGFVLSDRFQHPARFLVHVRQRGMSHVTALSPFLDYNRQAEQLDDSLCNTESGTKPPLVAVRQHQRSTP